MLCSPVSRAAGRWCPASGRPVDLTPPRSQPDEYYTSCLVSVKAAGEAAYLFLYHGPVLNTHRESYRRGTALWAGILEVDQPIGQGETRRHVGAGLETWAGLIPDRSGRIRDHLALIASIGTPRDCGRLTSGAT